MDRARFFIVESGSLHKSSKCVEDAWTKLYLIKSGNLPQEECLPALCRAPSDYLIQFNGNFVFALGR